MSFFLSSISRRISASIKYLLLLLPVLLLIPGLGEFPYPGLHAEYSDITVSHFPITYYIRYAIAKWHAVPLWSPDILSGYPLVADPLSNLLYPPAWLGLVLPLPFGFNFLVALHLIGGGIGMFLLARSQGLSELAAIFAALSFESMPKLFAHYGAGHITLIYAISWTPWLLYLKARSNNKAINDRYAFYGGLDGCVLGLIFLADPRWAIYAGLLWWGYALFGHPVGKGIRSILKIFLNMVYQSMIAAFVAAPLALPLLEYTQLSTRANLRVDEAMTFSLPPARLLGLIYPDFGGFHEWVFYPSAIVVLLCFMAVQRAGWRNKIGFWVWIALISLVFSLGENLPLGNYLASIPGFDLLRVPPRLLFIFGMACTQMAAYGLDSYFDADAVINIRKSKHILVAVLGFILVLTLGIFILTKKTPINFVWGASVFLFAAAYLWSLMSFRLTAVFGSEKHRVYFFCGFLFLLTLDAGFVDRTLFETRAVKDIFDDGNRVAAFLQNQPGIFRVYSPSYSLPQTTASIERLQLADGVHPLQLAAYADFMENASGIPQEGYSVTIPPYKNGNPKTDNMDYVPEGDLLGRLNVRFIVSEFELPGDDFKIIQKFNESLIYENLYARPRAWVVTEESNNVNSDDRIRVYDWTPNQIVVEAIGPGVLVLSEIHYPGWIALVDGEEQNIEITSDIFRSVRIDAGVHEVKFKFRPIRFYIGLGVSILGLVMIGMGLKRSV